jgi:hypothetical protein
MSRLFLLIRKESPGRLALQCTPEDSVAGRHRARAIPPEGRRWAGARIRSSQATPPRTLRGSVGT